MRTKKCRGFALTWNCFADKPVLLAIVAAYRAVVPRWTCASRPCVLRASCVNRSFSVAGVFVKRSGAPPPLVTITTRRPLVGTPRALFLPLPAMLEGTRGESQMLAARCVTSRGTRQTNKKIGANEIEAPRKVSRARSVDRRVFFGSRDSRTVVRPSFPRTRETRADRSNDLPADLAISRPKAIQLFTKIDSLGFGRGASARCASRH